MKVIPTKSTYMFPKKTIQNSHKSQIFVSYIVEKYILYEPRRNISLMPMFTNDKSY